MDKQVVDMTSFSFVVYYDWEEEVVVVEDCLNKPP